MAATAPAFEFCQYVHTDGRRCVTGWGHSGLHNVQPQSSASVMAINRREALIRKLSDERPRTLTGPALVASIDNAVAEQAEQIAGARARQSALGYVEGPIAPPAQHGLDAVQEPAVDPDTEATVQPELPPPAKPVQLADVEVTVDVEGS